jgi:hypothetical protein
VAAQAFRFILLFVRWWFGLTWIIGGVAGIIWAPFALADGDAGSIYLLIGGIGMVIGGWVIHPWGLVHTEGPRTMRVIPVASPAGRVISATRRRRRGAGM